MVEYISADWWLQPSMYLTDGREAHLGRITGAPDGTTFAMEQPNPGRFRCNSSGVLVLCRWDDFAPVRTIDLSDSWGEVTNLDASPDGRWLVAEAAERICLIDRLTGDTSHVIYGGTLTTGLTFDPTSTFVAGVRSADGGGSLRLWRLDPADRCVPRPLAKWERDVAPSDHVRGSAALTDMYGPLDRTGVEVSLSDIGDAEGAARLTPDSSIVAFSVRSAYSPGKLDISAYEVASGKRLWAAQGDDDLSSRFVFTPDGPYLIAPTWSGDLLVYRADTGALEHRLPSGLGPVKALAFDHDGTTLWLATEDLLMPCHPQW
jgi:WD40 repeat protein